jgi:KDO2-lipid IV(A) lauroyltransferase
MLTRVFLLLLRVLSTLPLPLLRALGAALGQLLYAVAASRRRVVWTNLQVCFPAWSGSKRKAVAREVFVRFAQAWLDRGWLWHRSAACIRARVRIVGQTQLLADDEATVLFAPHFMGLDVGWTALTLSMPRDFVTIFTPQRNAVADAWIAQGRQRFGRVRLCRREDGVKPIVSALRDKAWLYLLPDMNFGPSESIFVPFYGEPAATVPSLSRFAKLGRARVVPVVTRMTPTGYEVEILHAWHDFPTDDVEADTALMNARLQAWIDAQPGQYFWVHKRFKTRPEGRPELY